jgi:alcohol dehydrogenase
VMVTGLGARDADRLALASKFGADLAVDVSADDPVVELTKAAGALADVVVNVTARAPAAFAQAIALAGPAGYFGTAGTRLHRCVFRRIAGGTYRGSAFGSAGRRQR